MANTWVISDIHGCYRTLRTLIEKQVQPSGNDELIFLGDYIDRGINSKKVIDYLIELNQSIPVLKFLRGNHEEFALISYDKEKNLKKSWFFTERNKHFQEWMKHGGNDTLKSFNIKRITEMPEMYIEWMRKTIHYLENEDYIVVHAGMNFKLTDPREDTYAMMWLRDFKVEPSKIGNKKLIHGHVPVSLDFIRLTIETNQYPFIDLDNGVYHTSKTGMGNLIAFNLKSKDMLVQRNLDMD